MYMTITNMARNHVGYNFFDVKILQVLLAIFRGYVPDESLTTILGQNLAKAVNFPCYSQS